MKYKILLFGLIILTLITSAYTLWNWKAGAALRAIQKDALERGIPMKIEDIHFPNTEEGSNAAPALTLAFIITSGGSLDFSQQTPKIKALLKYETDLRKGNAPATDLGPMIGDPEIVEIIKQLQIASQHTAFLWTKDYTNADQFDFKYLTALRNAVRILCLQAINQIENQQFEAALSTLSDSIKLTDMMMSDPFLISYLFSVSTIRGVDLAMQQVLAKSPQGALPSSDLLRLRQQFSNMRKLASPRLLRAMDTERILYWQNHFIQIIEPSGNETYLDEIADMYGGSRGFAWYLKSFLFRPMHKIDFRIYLETEFRCRELASLPIEDALRANRFEEELPGYAYLSDLAFAPSPLAFQIRREHLEASLAITEAGLTLEAHYHQHGHYPKTLDLLYQDPLMPADPYTGKALNYHLETNGYALSSSAPSATEEVPALHHVGDVEKWKITR